MTLLKKGIMEDQRLLASAALFRQLHENKKDIYDVLGQFLCSTIVIHQLWEFDVTKCSQKLNSDYGFDIPEAVVKSCLKKRLKKQDLLTFNNGKYYVTEKFERNNSLKESYEQIKNEQDYIKQLLIEYINSISSEPLDKTKFEQLLADFYSYFIHDRKQGENTVIISQFIVKNSENPLFTDKLNKVEEGLILYGGICYSTDLVNAEPWRNDFEIILDTELLFDAVGLNGEIHHRMFTEFLDLIKELRDRSGNKSKIALKYFEETKAEIDDYFYAAERIFERNQHPDPSKIGMVNLLQECSSTTDVILKKIEFFEKLDRMKISIDVGTDYYENPRYNLEGISTLEELELEYPDYDPQKISDIVKTFSKINYKRKGNSKVRLEQSGALFITGKNMTKSLSHYFSSKGERLIPFAVTLDYITERLWFKSHKGFAKGAKLPITFDVVARAQVILSTQVTAKVAIVYNDMKKAVQNGSMSKETASSLIIELRNKNFQPEGFIAQQVEDITSFMDEDIIENAIRTKSFLEAQAEKAAENEKMVEELKKIIANKDAINLSLSRKNIINARQGKITKLKKKTKLKYKVIYTIYIFSLLTILALLFYFVYTPEDTSLAVISLIITLLPMIFGLFKLKSINIFMKKKLVTSFKKNLKKIINAHSLYSKKNEIHMSIAS
ncbi:TPA: hypothetical protein ACS724_003264 [Providencia alcalifaciens]